MGTPLVPQISVIMPVYNRAGTVRRAVDSVLAQQFQDFELIVVDDGSTDGTCAVLEKIVDPRVRLIRMTKNSGSNAARNCGIRESRSPLIAFLDSDDEYLPEKLGAAVQTFARRPELEVMVDSFTRVNSTGEKARSIVRRNPVIDSTEEFRTALFGRRLWKATPSISLRKDAALRAGLFDERVRRRQDFDFLVRASKVATCASTDRLLWIKHRMQNCISQDADRFVGSTLHLCRTAPEYVSNPTFRKGLARDVTSHLGKAVRRFKLRRAWRDAAELSRELGSGRFVQLLAEGSAELVRRRRKARS